MSTTNLQKSIKDITFLEEIEAISPYDRDRIQRGLGITRQGYWKYWGLGKMPPFGKLEKLRKASGISKEIFYNIVSKHLASNKGG